MNLIKKSQKRWISLQRRVCSMGVFTGVTNGEMRTSGLIRASRTDNKAINTKAMYCNKNRVTHERASTALMRKVRLTLLLSLWRSSCLQGETLNT